MKTVNLGLSKQLKEAGYPQDVVTNNIFWVKVEEFKGYYLRARNLIDKSVTEQIASPTADEILDQLPRQINIGGVNLFFEIIMGSGGEWQISYDYYKVIDILSLADAAAKMWIYLKKGNLLGEVKTGEEIK